MSSAHAFEMPEPVLEALRHHLAQTEIDAILSSGRPLSEAERRTLENGMQWWQQQYDTAQRHMRAISSRLSEISGPNGGRA